MTHSPGRSRRFLFGAVALILAVALSLTVAELGLRIAGFEFHTFPIVQFGSPKPKLLANQYVPDRDVFWVTRDYQSKLAEARRTHPVVVFMGDSCTEFGNYAQETLRLLAERHPATPIGGLKLGVGGWSSEQGLRQLERDIVPLHPRVITVYYGWNDHWIAFGPPDPDVRIGASAYWLFQHSRLAQLVSKSRFAFATTPKSGQPNRVDLPRYRQNLETIVRLAREAGIATVLITAPSNHIQGHEPTALKQRHLRTLTELVPLHRSYVEATREAARHSGAVLCDVARAFETLPPPHDPYFITDGIHLTESGDREIAGTLSRCIEEALAIR